MKPHSPIFPIVVGDQVKHGGIRIRMLLAMIAWVVTLKETPSHVQKGMSYKSRYLVARKAIDSADAFLDAYRDDLQEEAAEERTGDNTGRRTQGSRSNE